MCNCTSSPANICNQCAQGNTCGCPPDYTVMPLPVACGCCPTGFVYIPATPNNPATCRDIDGKTALPIPCPSCEETLSSNCVIVPPVTCIGFIGGSVTDLSNHLCSEAFITGLLVKINNSSVLATAFCRLVNACPATPVGSTPIIGPIISSFP